MPSCITASQVVQPEPAAPMRSSTRDAHAVEVDLVLRVGREAALLRQRHAVRARVDEEQVDRRRAPSPVRASTTSRVAAGERHVPLRAGEHEAVAVGLRARLHALRAEAAVRLEPRGREDRLARRRSRGSHALLLLVGARREQRAGRQHRAHEVRRRARATRPSSS